MLDMFEKLINEHGSSTILRERLQLASDKYSILEEKLESAQRQIAVLESENSRLSEQLERADNEISRLQSRIGSEDKAEARDELDEAKKKILLFLFESNQNATVGRLGKVIGAPESEARYHIDILRDKHLINLGPLITNQPRTYVIAKEGRKHVMEEINDQ